jgi:hypothetical protein
MAAPSAARSAICFQVKPKAVGNFVICAMFKTAIRSKYQQAKCHGNAADVRKYQQI